MKCDLDRASSARHHANVVDVVGQHRQACEGFTKVVGRVGDRWASPSPCTEWDARAVVEHVIGFHDVLLLRPLDAKPHRPKDDPVARWTVTADALFDVLGRPGVVDADRASLLGVLTTDILVHTWDLARAIGDQVDLDPELCEIGYNRARANLDRLAGSDMFAAPVAVPEDAQAQDRLLAVLGRDPTWSGPA